MPVTQQRLKELLCYDRGTGAFTYRISRRGVKAGAVAGTLNSNGLIRVSIDNKLYYAHQLAWLYVTGAWPESQIDHRDGVGVNNRFRNLRPATSAQNMQNLTLNAKNTSGFPGVSWSKREGKWRAQIRAHLHGGPRHLGWFTTPEAAARAYLYAKRRLHEFQPTMRKRATA